MRISVSPTSFGDRRLLGRSVVIVLDQGIDVAVALARQTRLTGASVVVFASTDGEIERVADGTIIEEWPSLDVEDREAIAAALADVPTIDHLVLLAGFEAFPRAVEDVAPGIRLRVDGQGSSRRSTQRAGALDRIIRPVSEATRREWRSRPRALPAVPSARRPGAGEP